MLNKRIYTFGIFIQAVADTLLFTGLALILAIYTARYGHQNINVYTCSIAVNTALLCCLFHLSIVNVLHDREYLGQATILRHLGVALMVADYNCPYVGSPDPRWDLM
jgi:hypothetical protein